MNNQTISLEENTAGLPGYVSDLVPIIHHGDRLVFNGTERVVAMPCNIGHPRNFPVTLDAVARKSAQAVSVQHFIVEESEGRLRFNPRSEDQTVAFGAGFYALYNLVLGRAGK